MASTETKDWLIRIGSALAGGAGGYLTAKGFQDPDEPENSASTLLSTLGGAALGGYVGDYAARNKESAPRERSSAITTLLGAATPSASTTGALAGGLTGLYAYNPFNAKNYEEKNMRPWPLPAKERRATAESEFHRGSDIATKAREAARELRDPATRAGVWSQLTDPGAAASAAIRKERSLRGALLDMATGMDTTGRARAGTSNLRRLGMTDPRFALMHSRGARLTHLVGLIAMLTMGGHEVGKMFE